MLIHIITCKKESTRFLQKTDPNKICMSQSKVQKINKHGYRLQCSLCITSKQVKFEHTQRKKNYHSAYFMYIPYKVRFIYPLKWYLMTLIWQFQKPAIIMGDEIQLWNILCNFFLDKYNHIALLWCSLPICFI